MTGAPARRLCLITGASSGIGVAFANLYASKGYDLALTARRADRLEALARDLSGRFGVEAIPLVADLSDPQTPARLVEGLTERGRHVDVLINNAGYGLRGDLPSRPWSEQQAFLQVLVNAPTELCHRIAPGMVERRHGRIVNVASVMGLIPAMPAQGLYSAAKAYVVRLSQTLHLELRRRDVHVTALCPGLTRSEFHEVAAIGKLVARAPPWMWMDAEPVVEAAYAAVEANQPICVPGAVNKALVGAARLLPERWGMALMALQTGR